MMLDHEHGVARVDESLQNAEQAIDVAEMQTRRRLVEDVERASGRDASELRAPA